MKQMARVEGVEPFVERVERGLAQALGEDAPSTAPGALVLLEAARHLALADGAKRSRPRLMLRFGRLLGAPEDALVDVAVAAEMIHAASLLHDDVIDEGAERRGLVAANVRWSNTVAVLGGDILLCLALERLRRHPPVLTFEGIETVTRQTTAVMQETEARRTLDWTLEGWRSIAEGKTGSLLGWCASACAHLAGLDDPAARALHRVGVHLGVAFQLADDLLDFRPTDTHKTGFADLRNRNPSFPVIWAMQREPSLARRIGAVLRAPAPTDEAIRRVAEEIVLAGAVEAGLRAIRTELDAALEGLPAVGGDEAADALSGWVAALVCRVEGAFEGGAS